MANTTWKQIVYDAADAYRTASATETQVKVGELATKISSLEDVTAEVTAQTPIIDSIMAELTGKVLIPPTMKIETGEFTAVDSSQQVVNHSLGMVPQTVFLYAKTVNNSLVPKLVFATTPAFMQQSGETYIYGIRVLDTLELLSKTGSEYSQDWQYITPTNTSITFSTSEENMFEGTYGWIAIGIPNEE